jgi:Fe-S oxidoreductase
VRFRKEEEMRKGAAKVRGQSVADAPVGRELAGDTSMPEVAEQPPVKILTSCPSCLQGLSRYADDAEVTADYIVVEIARHVLGKNWLPEYVQRANAGGIERVLV